MTSIARFIDSLTFPLVSEGSTEPYVPEPIEQNRNQLYNHTDTYLDDGNGRISRGLRGLELLSKLCRGVNPADLFLFNNVIYQSSAPEIKSADRNKLIEIVIANLGMTFVINAAEKSFSKEVDEFKELSYKIGYAVKSGVFDPETYKSTVLRSAKKLTYMATVGRSRYRYG